MLNSFLIKVSHYRYIQTWNACLTAISVTSLVFSVLYPHVWLHATVFYSLCRNGLIYGSNVILFNSNFKVAIYSKNTMISMKCLILALFLAVEAFVAVSGQSGYVAYKELACI